MHARFIQAIAIDGVGNFITGLLGSGGRTIAYPEAIGAIRIIRVE